MRAYLLDLVVWDPALGGTRTLRYATHARTTKPTDTPGNTYYRGCLKQPAQMVRHAFREGATFGRSRTVPGEIVLNNGDGALDDLLGYGFDGRRFTLKAGEHTAATSTFTTRLTGTMESAEFVAREVRIRIRDASLDLEVPLQPNKYAGDNVLPDGLEGTADDLLGKPKPICLGSPRNVPAVCVNTAKLIYQVNDGPVDSIAVYDRGVGIGAAPTGWETVTHGMAGSIDIRRTLESNGTIIVVGFDGTDGLVGRSTDHGATWSKRTVPGGTLSLFAVATDGAGTWIATGAPYATGSIRSTDDGATWSALTIDAGGASNLFAAYWSTVADLFIVAGTGGQMYTSPTGAGGTWTSRTSGASDTLWDIAELTRESIIVAVGENGALTTSTTGTTWTLGTSEHASDHIYRVAVIQDRLVAAGNAGKLSVSANGIAWTLGNSGLSEDLGASRQILALCEGAGIAALGGANSIAAMSFDGGETWERTDATTGTVYGMVFTNSRFIAAGAANIQLSASPIEYADEADLLNDDLAPQPGNYGVLLSGGYFRLGSAPDGMVTADVSQGNAASDRTAAEIFRALLHREWAVGGLLGEWNEDDLTDLDTATSGECGFFADQEMSVASAVDMVAITAGAFWGPDRSSVYRIKQLTAPSGAAVLTRNENQIKDLERIQPADGRGLPSFRSVVRYGRLNTVQATDVAYGVSTSRRGELAKEWREAEAVDEDVLEAHPLSPQTIEDSLFVDEADAQAEATRRQAMRGVQRDYLRGRIDLNDDTDSLELLDVVELTHDRFGLSGGEDVRVIGLEEDPAARKIILSAWK